MVFLAVFFFLHSSVCPKSLMCLTSKLFYLTYTFSSVPSPQLSLKLTVSFSPVDISISSSRLAVAVRIKQLSRRPSIAPKYCG